MKGAKIKEGEGTIKTSNVSAHEASKGNEAFKIFVK